MDRTAQDQNQYLQPLQALIDSIEKPVMLVNPQGHILLCSESAMNYLDIASNTPLTIANFRSSNLQAATSGLIESTLNKNESNWLRHVPLTTDGTEQVHIQIEILQVQGAQSPLLLVKIHPAEDTPSQLNSAVINAPASTTNTTTIDLLQIMKAAPVGILLIDESGHIKQSNQLISEWFGYASDELTGQRIELLMEADKQDYHSDLFQQYIAHPETRSLSKLKAQNVVRKDGSVFQAEIGLGPVLIEEAQYILVFLNDVSMHQKAEGSLREINTTLEGLVEIRTMALSESQSRLKLATQTAGIGVYDLDLTSNIISCDQRLFDIFGLQPPADMTTSMDRMLAFVHEDDSDMVQQQMAASSKKVVGENDANRQLIIRIRRADNGQIRYLSSNRTLIEGTSGKPSRLIGIVQDVTEARQAQIALEELAQSLERKVEERTQELARTERRFRQMADSSPVLLWLADPSGKLTWVNKSWEQWTGHHLLNEEQQSWYELIHPDDKAQSVSYLTSQISSGESFTLEFRLRNAQNNYGWVYQQCSPLIDNEGNIEGYLATCTDISWQKEQAEEQKRIERKLEQASKLDSLGLMAGGIAHDFNNLLTGILGNIELAQWETSSEQKMLKTFLEDARSAGLRAADLCKQMLAYSGKGQFLTDNCNANQIIRETLRLISTSIREEVTVSLQLEETLPEIMADKVQLQQVIMNLAINAAEAISGPGTVTICTGLTMLENEANSLVNADTHLSGPAIFISVKDNGCGMSLDDINRIFEPFFTTKFVGRGLGLSAVQGIIQGHEGKLIVDSTPDKGSMMRVVLPLNQSHQDDDAGPGKHSHFNHNSKILIVDDEEIVCKTLSRYLDHMRIYCDYVLTGKECVARFKSKPHTYELVILDLTMAGMDGYETFNEIRKYNQDIPIVLISGFTEKEATRHFSRDDLAGFLPKPISERTLTDLIKNLKTRD